MLARIFSESPGCNRGPSILDGSGEVNVSCPTLFQVLENAVELIHATVVNHQFSFSGSGVLHAHPGAETCREAVLKTADVGIRDGAGSSGTGRPGEHFPHQGFSFPH